MSVPPRALGRATALGRTALGRATALALAMTLAGPAVGQAAAEPMPVVTATQTTALAADSAYPSLQGGATDGRNWYTVSLRRTVTNGVARDEAVLIKTRLGTLQPAAERAFGLRGERTGLLGHGNDIAYNPRTGRLLVPAWTWEHDRSVPDPDQSRSIRLVDPRNLTVTGTVRLDRTVTSICYEPTTDRYVAGTFGEYAVYDGAFARQRVGPRLATSGLGQGIDCDASHIYVVSSPTAGRPDNQISVFTWDFTPVRSYAYRIRSESEHLLHADDTFYLGVDRRGAEDTLVRLDGFQFTVRYEPGGGGGTMAPTTVLCGAPMPARPAAFSRPGYAFAGWIAERSMDGRKQYQHPRIAERTGWYFPGTEPTGWDRRILADRADVSAAASRGTVTLTAVWTRTKNPIRPAA